MISNLKFSTFFILSLCALQFSSVILAVHVSHKGEAQAPEFMKAIETFLVKRDAGQIEHIRDKNYLFEVTSNDLIYKMSENNIADILLRYCPEGYKFTQSNGVRKGEIFDDHQKVFDFKLKKYNSAALKSFQNQKKRFSAKAWKITLIHTNGTKEFYLLFFPL